VEHQEKVPIQLRADAETEIGVGGCIISGSTGASAWRTAMSIEGPTSPVIIKPKCCGSFSAVLRYTTTDTTPLPVQGTPGSSTDFSELTATGTPSTIDKNHPADIVISGTLKEPCKAGFTSFTLNSVVTSISVLAVPFSKVTAPAETPSVGDDPAEFSFDVTFTCCKPGPGVPPGPFDIVAEGSPAGVTVTAIKPRKFRCAAKGAVTKVTVSGTVGPPYDGVSSIVLRVKYADGESCLVTGPRISG
jgi:hypothetical protein